jgi:hypothetical protein
MAQSLLKYQGTQPFRQKPSLKVNLLQLRYNTISDEYNCITSNKTIRLDCEGKHPFVRFYLQQDQVKGKTNLAEIYIHAELDKLMQLN